MTIAIYGSVLTSDRKFSVRDIIVISCETDNLEKKIILGTGSVDSDGKFEIDYDDSATVRDITSDFPKGGPDILLVVQDKDGNEIHRTEPISGPARFEPHRLIVDLPKHKPASLKDVLKTAAVPEVVVRRMKKDGIRDVSALLRANARGRLEGPDLNREDATRLSSISRLAVLGSNASLAGKLANAGLGSPLRLMRLSASRVAKRVEQQGSSLSGDEKADLSRLQRNARRVTNRMAHAGVLAARRKAADRDWQGGLEKPESVLGIEDDEKVFPDDEGYGDLCRDCDDCESIFSPMAYAHDLLVFIEDTFGVGPSDVGKIINQDLDLDCEAAVDPIKQIILGIEVLQHYAFDELSLNLNVIEWYDRFPKGVQSIRAVLGIGSEDPVDSELAQPSNSPPKLEDIIRLRDAAFRLGKEAIEKDLPSPEEAAGGADASSDAERATRAADLQTRIDMHVDQLLVDYRQALIDSVVKQSKKQLSKRAIEQNLFIDLSAAPCQVTSRIIQIIQSLQSLVLSIRTDSFVSLERAFLEQYETAFNQADFDEQSWTWLRTYRAWNAAIYAFVYTENILSPPVERHRVTGFFRDQVIARLLRGQASADAIDALDQDYADYFRRFSDLRPFVSHVIGDRLYIFARTGGSDDHALWMNILNTRDLYVPGATRETMRERSIGASGWFKIAGWDSEQEPTMAMPFGEDDELGFVVLGKDRTYKLGADGNLANEISFVTPSSIPATLEIKGKLILSLDNTTHDQTPTLWIRGAWLYNEGIIEGWHQAKFQKLTGEWDEWEFSSSSWFESVQFSGELPNSSGQHLLPVTRSADTSVGSILCRVDRVEHRTDKVALSFELDGGQEPFFLKQLNSVGDADSSLNSTVLIAWVRAQTDPRSFFVVGKSSGDILVQTVWLNTEPVDPSFAIPVSLKLASLAGHHEWPEEIKAGSAVARSIDLLDRYLYFPLLAGWALNRAGDFVTAHNCYLRLFNPFETQRQVFPFDQAFDGSFERSEDWLGTIRDPDAIARLRSGSYLRHTILMMVKNLIDWADHQFTLNTAESLNRARDLYRLAETVLGAPELVPDCASEIARIERLTARRVLYRSEHLAARQSPTTSGHLDLANPEQSLVANEIARLRQVNGREMLRKAIETIDDTLTDRSLGHTDVRRKIAAALNEALEAEQKRHEKRHEGGASSLLKQIENTRTITGMVMDHGIASHPSDRDLAGGRIVQPDDDLPLAVGSSIYSFCVPRNPLLSQLALHIEARQILLANCLDINGEQNQPIALTTGSLQGRVITTFDQLSAQASASSTNVPPYRYSFLIEKARQYASLAQHLEALMLAAIEKRDQAALAVLQAEIAEELAEATVNLKGLTREDAELGLEVAQSQLARTQVELGFWTERTSEGFWGELSVAEWSGMGLMLTSGGLQGLAAAGYFLLAGPTALSAAAGTLVAPSSGAGGAATAPSGWGALVGAGGVSGGIAAIGAAVLAGGPTFLSGVQAAASSAGTFGSLALTFASFERRFEDWMHQRDLAGVNFDIAGQQLGISENRIDIARQDEAIAELQQGHARLILEFHKNRFSNEPLYQWMIGILQDSYRDVMQRAASTARLAQSALEFERQQEINEIGGDYWSIDAGSLSDEQRRSGLLGAERLLTAMTRLDEFKIRTDKRRLQLAKTISLAHTFPSEFSKFKKTGHIQFQTLMNWFDQDYPGHYLRLIKTVRVAVLALVSPVDGIHATLSNNGISKVVKENGNGTFVNLTAVQPKRQQIAIDAASGDNGLFILDYRDPMLLPFEGLGVETGWTLDIPPAANSFNYDSLVDVLVTIEYTAVSSPDYRRQVIERLGTKRQVDRVISLRDSFPDQWYHLHNPVDPTAAHALKIDLPPYFFQQSAEGELGIRHMMIVLAGNMAGSRSGDLTIAKEGVTPERDVNTDSNNIFNSRQGAGMGPDNLPKPSFATHPSDPNKLLKPQEVGPDDKLLDPRGEWTLTFQSKWFEENDGGRDIDRLTDIILCLTIEYDASW